MEEGGSGVAFGASGISRSSVGVSTKEGAFLSVSSKNVGQGCMAVSSQGQSDCFFANGRRIAFLHPDGCTKGIPVSERGKRYGIRSCRFLANDRSAMWIDVEAESIVAEGTDDGEI
jgi:hypothetical protein